VRDIQAARRFYVDVLGFENVDEQHRGRIVWLKLGDREFLLRPGKPPAAETAYQQARAGIVLFTDDLPATLAALTARGLEIKGDDGPGCHTFTDLDGNWFQLVNPAHQ
jgi:catechol 2,3-dioxygenase-like lactoylglutathione lyase family enzyme